MNVVSMYAILPTCGDMGNVYSSGHIKRRHKIMKFFEFPRTLRTTPQSYSILIIDTVYNWTKHVVFAIIYIIYSLCATLSFFKVFQDASGGQTLHYLSQKTSRIGRERGS
jgi:hypothetical protein